MAEANPLKDIIKDIKKLVKAHGIAQSQLPNHAMAREVTVKEIAETIKNQGIETKKDDDKKVKRENKAQKNVDQARDAVTGRFISKNASGAAAAEDAKDKESKEKSRWSKLTNAVTGGFKGMRDAGKNLLGGSLPKLSTLALMGVGGAILAFMNSPAMNALKTFIYEKVLPVLQWTWDNIFKPLFDGILNFFDSQTWEDMKVWFVSLGKDIEEFWTNTLLPAFKSVGDFFETETWEKMKHLLDLAWMELQALYTNTIRPIVDIVLVAFKKQWEDWKIMFQKVLDGVIQIFEGDISGGIEKVFDGMWTYLKSSLDNLTTMLYNTIASVFGLEETDSVGGSIKNFFTNMYDEIVFWIGATWASAEYWVSSTWTNIKTTISDFFVNTKNKITGFWDDITGFVTKGFDDIVKWAKNLIGLGDDKELKKEVGEELSFSEIIGKAIKSALEFIKKIFSFDFESFARGVLGDSKIGKKILEWWDDEDTVSTEGQGHPGARQEMGMVDMVEEKISDFQKKRAESFAKSAQEEKWRNEGRPGYVLKPVGMRVRGGPLKKWFALKPGEDGYDPALDPLKPKQTVTPSQDFGDGHGGAADNAGVNVDASTSYNKGGDKINTSIFQQPMVDQFTHFNASN